MKRIVIKIGSSTLTSGTIELSKPQIADLVRQIAYLKEKGYQLIVVSSGAMTAGLETLGYPELPKIIPAKQMLAAVGQPRLMKIYVVDSAAVYVTASTRFTDESQLGLGAEVAISTQRLHARGPMALKELSTYKWVIQGDNRIRE